MNSLTLNRDTNSPHCRHAISKQQPNLTLINPSATVPPHMSRNLGSANHWIVVSIGHVSDYRSKKWMQQPETGLLLTALGRGERFADWGRTHRQPWPDRELSSTRSAWRNRGGSGKFPRGLVANALRFRDKPRSRERGRLGASGIGRPQILHSPFCSCLSRRDVLTW